jgi:4'-phosphopantetheinyl transferase
MINLFYYKITNRLAPALFSHLLQQIPLVLQTKILKFRNWQDAERSLAGKILLLKGLESIGRKEYTLDDLKYTEFQKPYFDDAIHFNITHSGDYVICALSETHKVGVDVEAIKDIPIDDFTNLFAKQEWAAVINSTNKLDAFYTLWTKKEAFLKAIGCGLSQPLNEVVIENNRIIWESHPWFLHEVKLDSNHIVYVCCNTAVPEITIEEIYF